MYNETMIEIVLGNVFSLLAMFSDSFSAKQTSRNKILLVQILSQVFYTLSSFVLKGYSATFQNATNIFRNLFVIYGKQSKVVEYLFFATALILGVIFNNRGFVGLLPIIANLEYTIAVFRIHDEYKLKLAFLVTVVLFGIFNLYIYNFVGLASNFFIFGSTVYFLIKEKRKREENE